MSQFSQRHNFFVRHTYTTTREHGFAFRIRGKSFMRDRPDFQVWSFATIFSPSRGNHETPRKIWKSFLESRKNERDDGEIVWITLKFVRFIRNSSVLLQFREEEKFGKNLARGLQFPSNWYEVSVSLSSNKDFHKKGNPSIVWESKMLRNIGDFHETGRNQASKRKTSEHLRSSFNGNIKLPFQYVSWQTWKFYRSLALWFNWFQFELT